ncbi:uncharacterized protein C8orf48 homolog [Polypterus senegalus]|uniref:uncharacterized protein C8orf48 homolog n=1 Tax=Polypterus senegalus TaxID=55291 RepID=UPI001962C160|nr:uncharacterized protein C8orf48 homolog [Polypterus senegalus]XP_039622268.1 uncharacterized protein C8orf48 homolog [Polypterus senegalus]XP_039622269.1 uncharacterized protein C8orf48 homolog [Polypterus senegalus]
MSSETEPNEKSHLCGQSVNDSCESEAGSSSSNSSSVRHLQASLESAGIESVRSESFGSSYCNEEFNSHVSLKEYEDEEFESYDEAEILGEDVLAEKWINILKEKASHSCMDHKKLLHSFLKTDTITMVPEEKEALKSYCRKKISVMRQQHQKTSTSGQTRQTEADDSNLKAVDSNLKCVVPEQIVRRLQMKSILEALKKATKVEMHEPQQCAACQGRQGELAEKNFIRIKTTQLESKLLQHRLEEFIYTKDPVCIVGEMLRDIPKISTDSDAVWQAFVKHKCTAE